MSGWMALDSAMKGNERKTVSRATLRRVVQFAKPHRRKLIVFVILSTLGAVITVATPVIAGRVVDAIVDGGRVRTVVMLALVIALLAVVDAINGVVERKQSAEIGEGLILDLRQTVFNHVQQMPLAFFTRTRTGALVSRLNSDVIGAQQAFTWTLSSVVSNAIALALTLGVMLNYSGRSPRWRWSCCRCS